MSGIITGGLGTPFIVTQGFGLGGDAGFIPGCAHGALTVQFYATATMTTDYYATAQFEVC